MVCPKDVPTPMSLLINRAIRDKTQVVMKSTMYSVFVRSDAEEECDEGRRKDEKTDVRVALNLFPRVLHDDAAIKQEWAKAIYARRDYSTDNQRQRPDNQRNFGGSASVYGGQIEFITIDLLNYYRTVFSGSGSIGRPNGSCVYCSSCDNTSPGRFNKGTHPRNSRSQGILASLVDRADDERLKPGGKAAYHLYTATTRELFIFMGFSSFSRTHSRARRGLPELEERTRREERVRIVERERGRVTARGRCVTAFSRLLLLPEIPSAPGRETPCPLNGVTGLPWLRGTPWNRRHRRAQRKAHLFWKNIIRTRARHEPRTPRSLLAGALASLPVHVLTLCCARQIPCPLSKTTPRLSGLNVMFNVADAYDVRSDNTRRETPSDCSRNSRNWRHAIN
ncbi:hypothetical protein DBV15_05504 [Temnothorax longispinosus]|uniref:Uncharacterized protein n=1 Tax=Temnothorax longispinosus TaxID=300112 RepID=A0A4S2KBM0_9HYME|nr:hypothetical protein DBV15_05504 [Temnothorax longispinosus]